MSNRSRSLTALGIAGVFMGLLSGVGSALAIYELRQSLDLQAHGEDIDVAEMIGTVRSLAESQRNLRTEAQENHQDIDRAGETLARADIEEVTSPNLAERSLQFATGITRSSVIELAAACCLMVGACCMLSAGPRAAKVAQWALVLHFVGFSAARLLTWYFVPDWLPIGLRIAGLGHVRSWAGGGVGILLSVCATSLHVAYPATGVLLLRRSILGRGCNLTAAKSPDHSQQ